MENRSGKIEGAKAPAGALKSTSWDAVAKWYDETVELEGSYQKELILPNLLRLMEIKKYEKVLDLACGQGFFSRAFAGAGATVVGADISKDLVRIAVEKSQTRLPKTFGQEEITYHVSPAHSLPFLKDGSVEKVAIVLALQNIEQFEETLKECARVLIPTGRLFIVLNHPAFRIPRASSWGFDEKAGVQFRRVDRYLSNSKEKISMNPSLNTAKGIEKEIFTLSFHRPLQAYVKALSKAGLVVRRLEEWNSAKVSEPGPRAKTENRARKEFPLFLAIEAIRLSV